MFGEDVRSFRIRHERRFPMLGARLYAMVNLFMLIFWPHLLVSSVRGVSFGGVATRVLQRCWMCEGGGLAGWYGR